MAINKLEVLEKYFGYKSFRRGQEKIIDKILSGKDVLAIMPTGGGKSLCYQVPALILEGITIVISPLISLMKDQVDTLNSIGINSAFLNSSLSTYEFNEVMNGIENEKYKIIYVAPERLHSNEFITAITQVKIAQIAIIGRAITSPKAEIITSNIRLPKICSGVRDFLVFWKRETSSISSWCALFISKSAISGT